MNSAGTIMIILFFAILIACVVLNARVNKNFKVEGTWIAVAIAPSVVWLLTTGQLSELAGFGLELKLQKVAKKPMRDFQSLTIEPITVEDRGKGNYKALRKMLEDKIPALRFQLGRTGILSSRIFARCDPDSERS